MNRPRRVRTDLPILASIACLLATSPSPGQTPSIRTADDLVQFSPAQLDALYAGGAAVALPAGKVRGVALPSPGTSFAAPASRASRLVWRGKVVDPSGVSAVNRFFGVRAVKGGLSMGSSWRDGNPALILDYQDSSWVYGRNRDEIRQIAPGVYLGLMYARTDGAPKFRTYFALQAGE